MTTCKHPGCLEPAVDQRGMYAHLCAFHKEQKKHDRQKKRESEAADPEPSKNGNGSHADAAERFLAAARALDAAELEYRAALEAVTR